MRTHGLLLERNAVPGGCSRSLENQHSVLVALEGRDATAVIPVAAELAARLRAEVTLLRVVRPPDRPLLWLAGDPWADGLASFTEAWRGFESEQDLVAGVEQLEREAEAELRLNESAFPCRDVRREVAIGADPAAEIISRIRQSPPSFVVMASRQRHPIQRLFGESTVEKVIRSGLAPVVAVRSDVAPRGSTATLQSCEASIPYAAGPRLPIIEEGRLHSIGP